MVSLSEVHSSNSRIASALPDQLVGVFVGATRGIGESTLKQFIKYSSQPRAYVIGRSPDAADQVVAQCRMINPKAEVHPIIADVSLIRVVDRVCAEIQAKENNINLLFLTAGVVSLGRKKTSENLHLLPAMAFYARLRFIANLLPLLQRAPALRRVVTVAAAGHEGRLYPEDLPALQIPMSAIRGHLTTLISLGLEAVAAKAPGVSFVHDYPGTVNTSLLTREGGVMMIIGMIMKIFLFFFGRWICVPIEECGQRQLYVASSARFPPADVGIDGGAGVPLSPTGYKARGTTGKVGSGLYSINWDGESASPAVETLLADLRTNGMVDHVWQHVEGEFSRITDGDVQ